MTTNRLIAIGDIHGCSRALATLLEAIDPRPDDTVVPLGDVVDRGPDSRGAIEQLMALRRSCEVISLLGNHEEMLLAARTSSVELRAWIAWGATHTLDSYGFGGIELLFEVHRNQLRGGRLAYRLGRQQRTDLAS